MFQGILIYILIAYIVSKYLHIIGIARIGNPRNWWGVYDWFLSLSCGLVGWLQPHEAFWDNKDDKPIRNETGNRILFVANHQLSAFDTPLAMSITYLETGIFTRAIADKLHFRIPVWRSIGWMMGAFEGSRESCSQAMEGHYALLVFPGGASEVWRSSHFPPYSLHWGNRKGFAELAIENNYTIIPISCIGMEDMVKTVFDIPAFLFFYLMGDKKR